MATRADDIPEFQLTVEQAGAIEYLAASLDRDRLNWVSGFLAGRAAQCDAVPVSGANAISMQLTVLYGSETGNAERLASSAAEKAANAGMAVRVVDMADYQVRELRDEQLLIIVTATHGEGSPPEPATGFYEYLHGRKAPALDGLKFAVLALGDSSYEHFCQTGRDFDARLEVLGATRLQERIDCDIDFAESAGGWIELALEAFGKEAGSDAGGTAATVLAFQRPRTVKPVYDRDRPFEAEVLENLNLNGRGSLRETRHVELSLAGSGIEYKPGDVLGLMAPNSAAVVDELVETLGLDPASTVTDGDEVRPLRDALLWNYEITTATPRFLKGWAERSTAEFLTELVADESGKMQRNYLQGRWLIDIVREYPADGLSVDAFLGLLRPLQPREYSIASSIRACPDEVHLTVSAVRFQFNGELRSGVASGFLSGSAEPGDCLPVYVRENRHFRLPADPQVPIIMIGPGTGVAPFRAFMQEREMVEAPGRNWLLFGSLHFRTDFLYQTEWQRWLKTGLLNRLDLAFSRDQAEKTYVQHRLLEHGREIYRWLEEGAHVYICGDAARMAPDVHSALLTILGREGGLTDDQASEYLSRLQSARRYQRDTY